MFTLSLLNRYMPSQDLRGQMQHLQMACFVLRPVRKPKWVNLQGLFWVIAAWGHCSWCLTRGRRVHTSILFEGYCPIFWRFIESKKCVKGLGVVPKCSTEKCLCVLFFWHHVLVLLFGASLMIGLLFITWSRVYTFSGQVCLSFTHAHNRFIN